MPITLFYELDKYGTFKFCKGIADVVMIFNSYEFCLGNVENLKAYSTWYTATQPEIDQGKRGCWMVSPQHQPYYQYLAKTGEKVVDKLDTLYRTSAPNSVWLFKEIMAKWSETFTEFSENPALTVAGHSEVGGRMSFFARKITAEFYTSKVHGPEFQSSEVETGGVNATKENGQNLWKPSKWYAWSRLVIAADRGVIAMARFIRCDEMFNGLTEEDQKELLQLLELQKESWHRTPAGLVDEDSGDSELEAEDVGDEINDPFANNDFCRSERKRVTIRMTRIHPHDNRDSDEDANSEVEFEIEHRDEKMDES